MTRRGRREAMGLVFDGSEHQTGEQGKSSGPRSDLGVVPDGIGLLLAVRAADRLAEVSHVRLTSLVTRPSIGWLPDDRKAMRLALEGGANAIVDGQAVTEQLATHRWLAWFPRPVGPHHAVNVPSGAVAVLGEVLPHLRLARGHLAVRTWQAELLQAGANLARRDGVRRAMKRWEERARDGRADGHDRWACVVEVVDTSGRLVRAWAYGTDRPGTSDQLAAHLGPMSDVPVAAWCTAPATGELLDAMADESDLRWSITGPGRP